MEATPQSTRFHLVFHHPGHHKVPNNFLFGSVCIPKDCVILEFYCGVIAVYTVNFKGFSQSFGGHWQASMCNFHN